MAGYIRSSCLKIVRKWREFHDLISLTITEIFQWSFEFRQLGNCVFPDRHFQQNRGPRCQRPKPSRFVDVSCVFICQVPTRFHFAVQSKIVNLCKSTRVTCFASRKESFTINKETPTRFRLNSISHSNYLDDSLGDDRRYNDVSNYECCDDKHDADHWSY